MELSTGPGQKRLRFTQGSNYFRQRLMLSMLSARPVKIEEIRSQLSAFELNVGVAPYEMSFIHLLDSLSNGSKFKINETGTEVGLIPGVLIGGNITYKCDPSRPLSYYLEPVLLLAPFCKKPIHLTLTGRLQNRAGYNSIYKIKHAALPILEKFGLEVDLQVISRGYDDSKIIFKSTVKKQLLTLRSQYNQEVGKVKKIRGLAYGFRVPPQMLSRIITTAKGEFLPFINDVFLTNDPIKNSKSKLPGYGLVMYAETTKGVVYASDEFVGREDAEMKDEQNITVLSKNLDDMKPGQKRGFELFPDMDEENKDKKKAKIEESELLEDNQSFKNKTPLKKSGHVVTSPEELGVRVARMLLKEISTQSRIDSVFQYLVLGLMALSPKDVSSVVLGPITPFTVQFLRDLKTFFGVTFKVENHKEAPVTEEDEDFEEDSKASHLQKLTCLGTGYINLNKTTV